MDKCKVIYDVYGNIMQHFGCLPHTGLDIWPYVVIGTLALVTGFLLRTWLKRS